jgi:peptidoglycan/xylan/chitin deacetylase (PgdA/CDA1 family)
MSASHEPVTVTTSWDDGHFLDLRLAEILDECQLPATFYISSASVEIAPADRLSHTGIRDIAERFEIGAHTLTHPRLTSLPVAVARHEIVAGRAHLEDITGRRVTSFCDPGGAFRPEHVRLVREAGFSYARTVRRFSLDAGSDSLRSPTTVQAYRHLVDVGPALTYAGLQPVAAWSLYRHWDRMAMRLFDRVLEVGGVFHLWGHSWEVDEHRQWGELQRVCEYIAGRPGVRYLDNGAISKMRGDAI